MSNVASLRPHIRVDLPVLRQILQNGLRDSSGKGHLCNKEKNILTSLYRHCVSLVQSPPTLSLQKVRDAITASLVT